MRPDGTKSVTITLTPAEHAELGRLAGKHRVHQSTMIRAALHCYHLHGVENVRSSAENFRVTAEHLANGTTPFGVLVAEGIERSGR